MKITLFGQRYSIIERIGQGGMAEVFRGFDKRLNRTVAIKILKSDKIADENIRKSFLLEASNVAKLNHPAINAVYDYGEEIIKDDNNQNFYVPYIILEYLEGKTLKELLRDERISFKKACQIIISVLKALEYSHERGIIHRDIKPANIMITSEGKTKLMDFGIAKGVDETSDSVHGNNVVVGTAQYISPEQARGEAGDKCSDIYSVGCVLFELVTGIIPFTGDSTDSIAYQHVHKPAPTPSKLNPYVPGILDQIILKALAKQPIKRYQDARTFCENLKGVLISGTLDHVPVVNRRKKPKSNKKKILIITIISVFVLAFAGFMVALSIGTFNSPASVPKKQTQTKKTTSKVTVPSLANLSLDDAKNKLKNAGFKIGKIIQEHNKDILSGYVIRTDPKAESKQLKGIIINIFVSDGLVKLPDVHNKTKEEASAILQELGLNVTYEEKEADQNADPATYDRVVDQFPASDTDIQQHSTVNLIILIPSKKVAVPDVTNMTQETAVKTLENAGLKTQIVLEASTTVTVGMVIRTDPSSGTALDKGSTVTIVIAKTA